MARPTGPRGKSGFYSESGADPRSGLLAFYERVHRAKEEGLDAMALQLVGQIKVELSTPGQGRVYRFARIRRDGTIKRNKRGRILFRTHHASAAGDPPAVDTGKLRNSIDFERITRGVGAQLTGAGPRITTGRRVGTATKYAPWLENGTSRILPRPFMAPAVRKVRTAMGNTLVGRLRSAVGT